ncbi:glutamine-hydrolyzing carbamoyl-phosphate synthase small subunit [Helicobacter turcicus]|uniref:Carbamoyl phosphate synthase small chain n=1 Tax=Helicobacter turcicus TaxID=2867412 RepID=A0ABS7JNU3_9HELI|nr:glutamine-hydrolyzing carbamoyl-phosphate synthase small subunit [Helicobacter turcicus]MBX7491052.1 glutamine-hydrolyzing carbamoyl-phosphate synthase small subunit [Helicobacter turcicus]MBX7546313.1 glutamine-hydrolyzing carbamoyl-phosphate synthase small subunit [Helicobacter turcicus]
MQSPLKDACIYLANGMFFKAKSFGTETTSVGELVFNTSLTGYQEITTDPSYAGQFVCFTMPEIGIVGTNPKDMESRGVFAKGILCRHYNENFSNFRATESLSTFLKKQGAMGICGIDTRFLTTTLRQEGAMMMVASTEITNKEDLKAILEKSPKIEEINHIKEVSTKAPYKHSTGNFDFTIMDYASPNTHQKIIAIDFGIKRSILNQLVSAGFNVEVVPHNFDAQDLIQRFKAGEFNGIFLSNGPGDPQVLTQEIASIKALIEAKIPLFAICLGHQLLSLAQGYPTYKLKFGHHGGNHPVKNLLTNQVEITAQNHNYSIPESIVEIAEITHRNLFDNTIEGVRYKNALICSFQHHPEAGPGPLESSALFKEFSKLLDSAK